jgi:putative flippase GtrA
MLKKSVPLGLVMNKRDLYQLSKYAIVGGGSAAIHYFVAVLLVFHLGASLQWANLAGFSCGFISSYLGQCLYTFKAKIGLKNIVGYVTLGCINYFFSVIVISVLEEISPWLSFGVVVALLPMVGFLVSKYILFANKG